MPDSFRPLFVIALLASLSHGPILFAAEFPNVLLIMTDDQGWGDVGRHGNDQIDTPVLDTLHDASVRFDRFYVSPVCAPTRAALLTGRYPVRTGVTGVTQRLEVMRAEEVTLAEVFQANGYATGCFGKWHNGEQYPNHPLGQGFDRFFGFCGGHWNNYFDTPLELNGQWRPTTGYISDVITNGALSFIDEHRGEPFFCYVPYNAPHSPWQVPDEFFDKYASRGLPATTACAYAMVENLDENIGRLLASLDDLGLRENTIVIFLTDNGPNTDRYNGDMRGRKGSVHEGGVRVPCFFSWPKELKPKTVRAIAAHIDILPTLAALCRLKLPETKPLDGISLAPLLRADGEAIPANWPDRMLITYRPTRDRQGRPVARSAVRTQRFRFTSERGEDQLFDMLADPSQKVNVAEREPQVFQRLRAAATFWEAERVAEKIERMQPGSAVGETKFDVSLDRLPIPVGFAAAPLVELPSVETLNIGNPRFHNGNGYAHDWVTDWTSPDDRIWWELDVETAGKYEVTLSYACAKADVGSTVSLIAQSPSGEKSLSFTIKEPFDTGKIARPERDTSGGPRWMREYRTMELGRLMLPAGRVNLILQATSVPGGSVCELDAVRLRQINTTTN